jgi:hypothetical protein
MLELANLLWVDSQYGADNAVPECFGDRYLYSNNNLFARIRDVCLSFGYRYTTEATVIWRDYDSAPFFSLQEFINGKVIPCKDNLNTLSRVSLRSPQLAISGDSLLRFVNRNYLLHESAHCISHSILPVVPEPLGSNDQRMEFVLKAVACEAFANVVERMAHAYAEQSAHVLFLDMNSYVTFSAQQRRLLRDSISLLGMTNVFRLGFFTFLYLNTHSDQPSERVIEAVINAAFRSKPLSPVERHIAAILSQAVFTLSRSFREETSSLFFRIFGCEEQYRKSGNITFSEDKIIEIREPWIDALAKSVFSDFEDSGIISRAASANRNHVQERVKASATT